MSQDHSLDTAFDKGLQMAFPSVVIQLLQALLEPEPSFAVISGFLKKDPMLASKVLHMVNTAHYGFSQKITNIDQAAMALGTSELFKLLIALSLQKRLNPSCERKAEHIAGDWRLTLWSAFAAEAIAGHFCPGRRQQAYLAAMLKDVQLFLAFCQEEAPPFLRDRELATLPGEALFAEEAQYWGSTHPSLAQAIFLYWGFPVEMAEAVEAHHDFLNAACHSPLARSVIFATRWAELLIPDSADPGKLAAFELALAKELAFEQREMELFRNGLVENFTLLLTQLGIDRADPETRLYDKPLSSIQSYYLLALRSVDSLCSTSRRPRGDILRDQLRLFWNVTSWELGLLPIAAQRALLVRCEDGNLTVKQTDAEPAPSPQRGWETLVIQGFRQTYGYLSVCAASRDGWATPLAMFTHMLGMCLDERNEPGAAANLPQAARDIPVLLARLDERGAILDATAAFFKAFGLREAPEGISVNELLRDKLGIDYTRLDGIAGFTDQSAGGIAFTGAGGLPASPVYINRYSDKARKGGSYLLLGDIAALLGEQSLALMFPNFLGALFSCLREQICLLDKNGFVLFHSPPAAALANANIFTVSRPLRLSRGDWNKGLLAHIDSPLTMQASLAGKNPSEPVEMVFTPLPWGARRCYLLTLRPVADAPQPVGARESA